LRDLDLSGTGLTDAGLKYLKGLTSLKMLFIEDMQVTLPGLQRLKEALPNVLIFGW
jgi:hypothetical protein